ncbi:MAG: type II 3-dehydroquinate dehydratase [Methylococcus sp.]|jgi:3-dehydroquinate dehydratase-2|nr:MAG: type II 3-dehydroquinate dehydratase [Methylococcus sp.]
MAKLLVLNGPNLNLLGLREPSIYGREHLSEIEARLVESAQQRGHDLECFQSNAESSLIDRIHLAYREDVDVVLINPGALTHTSIALRDAFLSTKIPFIEIHLSNVHAREAFRHHSYLSDIALGVILGLGPIGYSLALEAALHIIHLQQGQ